MSVGSSLSSIVSSTPSLTVSHQYQSENHDPLGKPPENCQLPEFIFLIGKGQPPSEEEVQSLKEMKASSEPTLTTPFVVSDEHAETPSNCCRALWQRCVRIWREPDPVKVTVEDEFKKHPEVQRAFWLGDIKPAETSDYSDYNGGWPVWKINDNSCVCFVNDPKYEDHSKSINTAGGGLVPAGKMPIKSMADALLAAITLQHPGLLSSDEDQLIFERGLKYRYGINN